jgi:HAE1 family hydrophobic/amphiphilic exporter-1
MLVAVYSHGTYDEVLANYAFINLLIPSRGRRASARSGTGAGQYAMRLWVKPDQLAKLGITVTEIVSAIQSQNTVNRWTGRRRAYSCDHSSPMRCGRRAAWSHRKIRRDCGRESPQGGVVRVKMSRVELGRRFPSPDDAVNRAPLLPVPVA